MIKDITRTGSEHIIHEYKNIDGHLFLCQRPGQVQR